MIGIFDSGYGGLTIMRALVDTMPEYDYLYLGDNARAPYGGRSFQTVYQYTLEAVNWLFDQGCPMVILACNTASAKALRTIQQIDLPKMPAGRRVLGVIRPTTEVIGQFTRSREIGILATAGTVNSASYQLEIAKFFPEVKVFLQACPLFVPLIEHNEHHTPAAVFFVKQYVHALLNQAPGIDTMLLACTHYPLIQDEIAKVAGEHIRIINQGDIVAHSLSDYLLRHPEMKQKLGKNGGRHFYTTDDAGDFDRHATLFYGEPVASRHADLTVGTDRSGS